MERVVAPVAAGVLSALGLAVSERRRDLVESVLLSGEALTRDHVAAVVQRLGVRGREELRADDAELRATYELRYRGQAFELSVEAGEEPDPAELVEAFAAEHERRYGYRDDAAGVELVNIRLGLIEPGPELELEAAPVGSLTRETRRAHFAGEWHEAEVLRGEPGEGTTAEGPCVFELPEATLVLPPGWRAEVDAAGTIAAEKSA